jgi:hypothetical protein
VIPAARRVWTAANAVLLAYAVRTAFALALLGPFGFAAASLLSTAQPADPRGDEAILELLQLVIRAVPSQARWMLALVIAYALIAPLLTQLIVESLARPARLRISLRAAWPRYSRALLLSVLRWVLVGLCAALAVLACIGLPSHVPATFEQAARFVPLAVGAMGLLWISTAHDLCAVELAHADRRSDPWLRRGARAARLAPVMMLAACCVVSAAIFALSDLLARAITLPIAAVTMQQTAGMLSALARALWLALASELRSSSARSRAQPSSTDYDLNPE